MDEIIISIRPEWCEKILKGEKTVEIRKSCPHFVEYPFRCFIYCTKSGWTLTKSHCTDRIYRAPEGHAAALERVGNQVYNGKVIAEFICKDMRFYSGISADLAVSEMKTGLTAEEIDAYTRKRPFYAWGISALKIYDRPKDLAELGIKNAPQSWGYMEDAK